MTVANMDDPGTMTGAPVKGSDGAKLGKIDAIYFDNDTNKPEWAAVKSGLFGGQVSLVPLQRGEWDGSTLTVPFDKDALEAAPHHDPDRELSPTDEDELYRHYGMPAGGGDSPTGGQPVGPAASGDGQARQSTADGDRRDRSGDAGIQGRDTSGPTTDDAMTRSEEQLHVGTEQRESGRARLRKHIVSENVSKTVPVSHEEVTLEREPITDANRGDAVAGGDLSEETHEVTLTEQRATSSKETVPVERVRLGTETVTEDHEVNETVRKEQIETEGTEGVDVDRNRGGDRR